MASERFDPAYWRGRAEESRAIAYQFTDPECRRTIIRILEGYEDLARRFESAALNSTAQDDRRPRGRKV